MTTITITQGYQESARERYWGPNGDQWSDLATSPYQTWTNWTTWTSSPSNLILQLDDDLGSVAARAPLLSFDLLGEAAIVLKISTTGAFAGEETTINFSPGTTYTYVNGRYYRWTVTVSATSYDPVPCIISPNTAYDSTTLSTETYTQLDTTTLSGSSASRTVNTRFGTVYNCQITTKVGTAWTDRAYSLPDAYSNPASIAPIGGVVGLSPLQIRLVDHFSQPVDGYVDLYIVGLPKITQASAGTGVTIT